MGIYDGSANVRMPGYTPWPTNYKCSGCGQYISNGAYHVCPATIMTGYNWSAPPTPRTIEDRLEDIEKQTAGLWDLLVAASDRVECLERLVQRLVDRYAPEEPATSSDTYINVGTGFISPANWNNTATVTDLGPTIYETPGCVSGNASTPTQYFKSPATWGASARPGYIGDGTPGGLEE